MKILEIAFVCYSVTDISRSRDFYEKTLGFVPVKVFGDAKASWVEYDFGPHTLAITNMAAEWKPSPQGASAAFEVEDFDAAIAELKAKGVKFAMEPFNSPVCRMAIICDPDDSKICIHKRNPVKIKVPG